MCNGFNEYQKAAFLKRWLYMQRELHELSKEELIEVVQDYQEMVSELEELSHNLMNTTPMPGFRAGDAINDILYKERPGWRIHDKEKQ